MRRATALTIALLGLSLLIVDFSRTHAVAQAQASDDSDDYILKLPEDPLRITIIQRESRPIPGSRKAIRAHLGDITAGQALFGIDTIDDRTLVERRSVRAGDVIELRVSGTTFYVHVIELKNFLTGEDFGVFDIRTTPPPATQPATAPTTRPTG